MAYSYDDMMGDAQPAHMGSQSQTGTQLAGDVVEFPVSQAVNDFQRMHSAKQPIPPKTGTDKPILFPGVKD